MEFGDRTITEAGDPSVDELAERFGRVCTLVGEGELEEAACEADAEEIVTAILHALRGRAHLTQSALHQLLDALDDRMAAAGFGIVTRSSKGYQPLPGTSGGRPVIHRWTCPAAQPCGRFPSTELHPEAPVCAATGRPFVHGRVRL
ncbi:hypothetical protein [Streptomyces regalis]|uniref:Uncharacterized protein n=1 Tax=Streptomyces regalis TaxID=68262 RepID=A0A117MJW1_9ACTN|nr:hypothetical protein [Streptomyces regalis]KUL21385.1 hypothetical protein ADL12_44980 [Streptomyces regalis]